MGPDKAKSLLNDTKGNTLLDLIAEQVGKMLAEFKGDLNIVDGAHVLVSRLVEIAGRLAHGPAYRG